MFGKNSEQRSLPTALKDRLLTRLRPVSVITNLPKPRDLSVLILGAAFLCIPAFGATEPASREQGPSSTCAVCHAEVVKGGIDSPHGKRGKMNDGREATCDNCHGPSDAHVQSVDTPRIFNPAKAPVKEADARCLGCHGGQHANFDRSAHAAGNVSCVQCHTVHSSKEERILKLSQPALCFKCHGDVEQKFAMPVHHKVDEQLVRCTDCHDPHAASHPLHSGHVAQENLACFKCHKRLTGPFVYEHPAVTDGGCMSCHVPHGGNFPKLLTSANVNTICLQCHLPSPTLDARTDSAHAPSTKESCISCHSSLHGSNFENRFVLLY